MGRTAAAKPSGSTQSTRHDGSDPDGSPANSGGPFCFLCEKNVERIPVASIIGL